MGHVVPLLYFVIRNTCSPCNILKLILKTIVSEILEFGLEYATEYHAENKKD
jgi:hypothetical protein